MSQLLTTLSAQITEQGVFAPTYEDVLFTLQSRVRDIFGADVYIEPDSQDGQLLSIFALAIHDCNQTAVAVFRAFSPDTAIGRGLSSVVKINHIKRRAATKSLANLTVVGVAGTTILSGVAGDTTGGKWLLPTPIVIPPGGSAIVTASAQEAGAVSAGANSITQILTPTAGWQSVNNVAPAVLGAPEETDGELRIRQALSPAIRSNTVLSGIQAALLALPSVTYCRVYENDTAATDSDGIPEHSIACVVSGGVAADIAATIYRMKAPGVGTHGTTTVNVPDVTGVLRAVKFFAPTLVPMKVSVLLQAGAQYNTALGTRIKQEIAAAINALDVGEDLVVNRLYVPALLRGDPIESEKYTITALTAAKLPDSLGTATVIVAYTERATCTEANVTIVIV